jgi:hypothetical protein
MVDRRMEEYIKQLSEHLRNENQDEDRKQEIFTYLWSNSILSLRQKLKKVNYPSPCSSSTNELLHSISSLCQAIYHIEGLRHRVLKDSNAENLAMDPVLQELCRPIVERIRYHFISHENERLATPTTRIERLPEWLLGYMRENIFEKEGGPWEVVCFISCQAEQGEVTSPSNKKRTFCVDFINEMIRMIQWVLMERDFFRHADIAGLHSKPIYLMQAIEQLLQFDLYIKEDILYLSSNNMNLSPRAVISLLDACVLGDEELLHWWLEREREYISSVLFDSSNPVTIPRANLADELNCISPRAELFCSVWRSVQMKANAFSFQGPYLSTIVAPICVRFLDSIHSSASSLRAQLLSFQRLQNRLPSNQQLLDNIFQWIQLINGTHMVATMLKTSIAQSEIDGDTERFGQSLERLHFVIVDDLMDTIIEVMIMERAKLAGYLMRCSFLLVHEPSEQDEKFQYEVFSSDLYETHRIVSIIISYCSDLGANLNNPDPNSDPLHVYAPRIVRERLLSSIAEKFLEVALDVQGMTPDLRLFGCMTFARDVNALLVADDRSLSPEYVLRVLDIVKLMQCDSATLRKIGNSLCELSGQSAPLTDATFEGDDKLYGEAISMILAKGFMYLELSDVFAILNRRRDL